MLPQGAIQAVAFDKLFNFILITCLISFALIVIGKVYFVFRFHRRKCPEHQTSYITGHTKTELSICFILLVWVMIIFYWGWVDYMKLKTPPADAYEINVIAKQWLWQFQYADGRMLTNELIVPKGRPVNLIMTSQDVIHSFFVPDFRVKQDVVPGTYTAVWFQATKAGEYQVFCAEYCGTAHSKMLAKVKVLEPDDFEAWEQGLAETENTGGVVPAAQAASSRGKTPADLGQILYGTKGCNACHSIDGSLLVGPSLKGIFGTEVELNDGKKVRVDENYIRESIMEPNAKIVKGFAPMMPTFKGQLSDEEINDLVALIKSLKGGGQ